MNINKPHLNIDYLLNVPLSFILQDTTIEKIEEIVDENGWNLLHYAVANCNINKIKELIHYNFNLSLNSTNNKLNINVFFVNNKKKPNSILFPKKINFLFKGFSPLHLALFLYNYYSTFSEDFFYQSISIKYLSILDILINENTSFKLVFDQDKNSLFDICFIMENIFLINLIYNKDKNFSTLNNILPTTALKILQVMKIKQEFNDKNNEKIYEEILLSLNKKQLKRELTTNLSINNTLHKINKI